MVHGDVFQQTLGEHNAIIEKDHVEVIRGNAEVRVNGDHREAVWGKYSLVVERDRNENVGTSYGLQAVQAIHLKSGMKMVMEAGAALTIKGPGGFIKIDADGVTIEGAMVKINCGGHADEGGSIAPEELQRSLGEGGTFGKAVDAALQVPEPPANADKSRSGYVSAPPPPPSKN
jgi:type VI secretion system secreted protein VgrG